MLVFCRFLELPLVDRLVSCDSRRLPDRLDSRPDFLAFLPDDFFDSSLDLLDSLSVDFCDSPSLDLASLEDRCDSSSVLDSADDSESDVPDELLDERLLRDELVDSTNEADFREDATDWTVRLEKIDS